MAQKLTKLKDIFKHVSSIDLGKEILFEDLELYNKETETSKQYKSIEEAENDLALMEKVNKINFTLGGGRGANSSKKGKDGKYPGFSGAGGARDSGSSKALHPASLNNQGRFSSVEGTIQTFIKKHGGSKTEYSTAVDSQGFAHNYVHGGKNSVQILPISGGFTAIHNHPNGSNFSSTDLHSFAALKGMNTLVATNSSKAYRITKGANFDAKGFDKSVSKSRFTTKDYNKGADLWLKKNAKKYGYTYSYE